jgi:hypothetical protein
MVPDGSGCKPAASFLYSAIVGWEAIGDEALWLGLRADRSHAHLGRARNRWMAARMVRTIGSETATSARWKALAVLEYRNRFLGL